MPQQVSYIQLDDNPDPDPSPNPNTNSNPNPNPGRDPNPDPGPDLDPNPDPIPNQTYGFLNFVHESDAVLFWEAGQAPPPRLHLAAHTTLDPRPSSKPRLC